MPLRYCRAAILGCWVAAFAAQGAEFGLDQVIVKAKELAQKSWSPPPQVPDFMRKLSYDEFRSIRFDPNRSLWHGTGSRFEVMLMVPGLYFTHPVRLNVINGRGITPVPFKREWFQSDDAELMKKLPADLGYAGFKLTYPINSPNVQDQFLVFAGASYFRAVGKGDNFGLSLRGSAIDTALPSGEEFPAFVEFWLEKPANDAKSMRVFGLLDSKRLAGAYQFTITPGDVTRVEVKSVLFARDRLEQLGVAPLTSMFFYGESSTRPTGHWRPEVHDSDGLLVQDGNGEWLWNPLMNPRALNVQSFIVRDVKGFGLMHRDQRFASYEDPEARYERRPSAWVSPVGSWGPGRVVLVEIPSREEINDNIVAFWSPPASISRGAELKFDYRIDIGDAPVVQASNSEIPTTLGRSVQTFVGRGEFDGPGDTTGRYRILVDFKGGALDARAPSAPLRAEVSAMEGGQVLEHSVFWVEGSESWRLSILAKPAENKPVALRALLLQADKPLTETWTYTLQPESLIPEPVK
jgi:periplasmic glucans biosynthesis protein